MATHFEAEVPAAREDGLLKYRGVIQEIGPMVEEFLPHGILIFFGAAAPAELREVALVHNGSTLEAELVVGDILQFLPSAREQETEVRPQRFRLTAIGEVANTNLAQLGHVVVHFDAASRASLPGAISVEPALEYVPTLGTTIEIIGGEKTK